jgi:hypothetical protein
MLNFFDQAWCWPPCAAYLLIFFFLEAEVCILSEAE